MDSATCSPAAATAHLRETSRVQDVLAPHPQTNTNTRLECASSSHFTSSLLTEWPKQNHVSGVPCQMKVSGIDQTSLGMVSFLHFSEYGESSSCRPASLYVKFCAASASYFHQDCLGDADESVVQWLPAAVIQPSHKSHQLFPSLQVCPINTLPSQLHH